MAIDINAIYDQLESHKYVDTTFDEECYEALAVDDMISYLVNEVRTINRRYEDLFIAYSELLEARQK